MTGSGEHLHFFRYEFKYLLPSPQLHILTRELDRRLSRDIHSREDGHYPIRSIYFDSHSMRWFREKQDGLHKRFKFRLRNYSHSIDRFSHPLFLELKGRNGSLVVKHRVLLEPDGFQEVLSEGASALRNLLYLSYSGNMVAERFIAQSFRYRISPSVITDYRRAAWEDPSNPDFRATIDTETTAWRSSPMGLPRGIPREIVPEAGIVEIKFRYRIPVWFQRLIRDMGLVRVSCSKFQRAVESVFLAGDGELLDRAVERSKACLH